MTVGENNTIGTKLSIISNSAIIGHSNTIATIENGNNSFIFGKENVITENNSYILGTSSTISAEGGASIGRENTVEGSYSTAIGTWCSTSGIYGIAFGRSAAAAKNSTAIGWRSEASGMASFSFGRRVKSLADNSMTIGRGRATDYLENNIESSLMIGFNSTVPTLFVGESSASDKSGRVGIGNITDPQAKLHIKGDSGEEATIMLEAPDFYYARIYFNQTDKYIASSSALENIEFHVPNGGSFMFKNGDATFAQNVDVTGNINFIGELLHDGSPFKSSKWEESGDDIYFGNGNVGIGTSIPSAKLDVNGTIEVNGDATFTQNLDVT